MKPWIDRKVLETQATEFVKRNGYFLRTHAKRISGLVEVAVYNSIVSYYDFQKYALKVLYPGPKKSFKYRLASTGLITNYSCFEATHPKTGESILILQNIKIQSAYDNHLYYTPDVVVCKIDGALTAKQKSGIRHSYISSTALLTFVEVKHLIPSPEMLFSFTGLVIEFAPQFIAGTVKLLHSMGHLSPTLVFTGVPSKHSERIVRSLTKRYGINIICSTQKSDGQIADYHSLNKFSASQQAGPGYPPQGVGSPDP